MTDFKNHSFYNLTPHQVMEAVEFTGLEPTGEYIQLNSYENRVFEVKLETHSESYNRHRKQLGIANSVIVKAYRPGRWSREAILEEHFFLQGLFLAGLPVIAPLSFEEFPDQTLLNYEQMYFVFFPKARGRIPQELFAEDYRKIGRSLALLHNVGEQQKAQYRLTLNTQTFGYEVLDLLEYWIAPEFRIRYMQAAKPILAYLDEVLEPNSFIRIHGDCHRGNLLQTDPTEGHKSFFFVDFDDFINGPTAQDFWMLFSGLEESEQELDWLLSGYEDLRVFPDKQLQLFQPLRGLRIIYYAGWIARRWQDPSFPKLFPQFKDYTYWAEETETLEKIAWNL